MSEPENIAVPLNLLPEDDEELLNPIVDTTCLAPNSVRLSNTSQRGSNNPVSPNPNDNPLSLESVLHFNKPVLSEVLQKNFNVSKSDDTIEKMTAVWDALIEKLKDLAQNLVPQIKSQVERFVEPYKQYCSEHKLLLAFLAFVVALLLIPIVMYVVLALISLGVLLIGIICVEGFILLIGFLALVAIIIVIMIFAIPTGMLLFVAVYLTDAIQGCFCCSLENKKRVQDGEKQKLLEN